MATITASLLSASCMAIGFLVFTMSTLTPFDNIGVMTIKMISSTSMTSTIGVTLMSASGGGHQRDSNGGCHAGAADHLYGHHPDVVEGRERGHGEDQEPDRHARRRQERRRYGRHYARWQGLPGQQPDPARGSSAQGEGHAHQQARQDGLRKGRPAGSL